MHRRDGRVQCNKRKKRTSYLTRVRQANDSRLPSSGSYLSLEMPPKIYECFAMYTRCGSEPRNGGCPKCCNVALEGCVDAHDCSGVQERVSVPHSDDLIADGTKGPSVPCDEDDHQRRTKIFKNSLSEGFERKY